MNRIVRTTAVAAAVALAGITPFAVSSANAATQPAAVTTAKVTSPLWLKADTTFRQGHDLSLSGDAGDDAKGRAYMRATVVGPHGMRAVLTPGADVGHLVGTIHVPAALKGTWIRLTLIAPNGKHVSTIVKHV